MVKEALTALQQALPPGALWTNTELFECYNYTTERVCVAPVPGGRKPAPWARIAAQLANEAPFMAKATAWEWFSCLSPYTSSDTAALYKQYIAGTGGAQPQATAAIEQAAEEQAAEDPQSHVRAHLGKS